MNWSHFILWTAGMYLLYYPAMILYDLSRAGGTAKPITGELTFSEDTSPRQIEHEPEKPAAVKKPDSPIISSGGVSLKNLFNLCREEAVIYTRPVSF